MNVLKTKSYLFFMVLAVALIGLMGLAACTGDDDDDDDDDDTGDDDDDDDTAPMDAHVRAIHLSPDAPNVDIYVETILAFADVAFKQGTEYADLAPDSYTFSITAAGGAIDDAVLVIPDLALEEDVFYTAVAFNLLADIEPLALVDDYDDLAAGNIRVRAIHTAAGVDQVDIWVIPDEGDPFILFENFDFGAVSDYVDLPVAAYTLGLDVDDDEVPDLVFEIPELPDGEVANVFAVNDDGDVFLLAQLTDGTTVQIDPTV